MFDLLFLSIDWPFKDIKLSGNYFISIVSFFWRVKTDHLYYKFWMVGLLKFWRQTQFEKIHALLLLFCLVEQCLILGYSLTATTNLFLLLLGRIMLANSGVCQSQPICFLDVPPPALDALLSRDCPELSLLFFTRRKKYI